jgi:hypothetical protein
LKCYEVSSAHGILELLPNNERRVSIVRLELETTSIAKARKTFQQAIASVLDQLSYAAQVPFQVVQVTVIDQKNQITTTEVNTPYPNFALTASFVSLEIPALAPAYAMYREAMNSSSPFYRFFCFYKILEGLLKKVKSDLYATAKRHSICIPRMEAKVPLINDMSADLKPYAGKSITYDGNILNLHELDAIASYSSVIHLTNLCCREVLNYYQACTTQIQAELGSKYA